MNCTRAALALALLLYWAQHGVGQSVYRCERDGEIIFSQVPCSQETIDQSAAERDRQAQIEAEADRLMAEQRQKLSGGRTSGDPVRMARRSCRIRGTGTTEAIVEVKNDLPRPVRARLTIHFIRKGDIIGVEKPTFTIPANASETISRLGPLKVSADRCEYSLDAAL